MYEKMRESAAFLSRAFGGRIPSVALVLGSGLGPLADELKDPVKFRTSAVPQHPIMQAVWY